MSNQTADVSQNSETKSKVLVCDDSKIVRMTAKKILAERFDLILAEDGEQAWTLISADPDIQIVFTDLGMPNLDGYGLIQRVRTSSEQRIQVLPLIVITGAEEDDEEIKSKLFSLGATDFITKPFNATSILARAEAHTSYQRTTRVLQENVNVDTLTGALNRDGLNKRLEKDLSLVCRHKENLVFVVFELDDFEEIYQRIGKKVSDNIIQTVAKLLNSAVRKEDSVARDGLSRFFISLPTAKAGGVVNLAERICTKINAFKLKLGAETLSLSASVGVTSTEKDSAISANDVIANACTALDHARSRGRGLVESFIPSQQTSKATEASISIDELLEKISVGDTSMEGIDMDAALRTISPLIKLMTKEQRRMLLSD